MHLLIDHAAPAGPRCRQAMSRLRLPHLERLLQSRRQELAGTDDGHSFSSLFEQMQAQAMGLPSRDGLIAWAALDAAQRGLPAAERAWAWITLCHWQVNTDHVEMLEPQQLQLSADESAVFMQAMAPYFAGDGIALYPCSSHTWLACGAVFQDLPTVGLARAQGRIDDWVARQPLPKALRRLQSEMQMLLYTHALNAQRQAKGLTTVNAFWVSGTGPLPPELPTADPGRAVVPNHSLTRAARRDDADAWCQAWAELDRDVLGPLTPAACLTLCGPAHALRCVPAARAWLTRLRHRWSAPTAARVLSTL